MENLPLLDIVIGLSLIYTFLSLLASELTEYIVRALRWKSKCLTQCIIILLGESSLQANSERFKDSITSKLLTSSRIASVTQSSRQRSHSIILSSITPQLFAETLLEVLQNLPQSSESISQQNLSVNSITQLQSIVESSPNLSPSLRTNLTRLIQRVQILEPDPEQQMTRLKHEIGRWFSHAMAEMTNRYKYHYKLVSLLVSLGLTVAVNVDSLYIIRRISENTALRAVTMQNATQIQGCQNNLSSPECTERLSTLMESTTIPIGWQPSNRGKQFARINDVTILRTIGGWLLTSIAIAMGARFWLQLLKRLSAFWSKESPPQRTSNSVAFDGDSKYHSSRSLETPRF